MFNASFLVASLIWSSVGFGYFIYGKKQRLWVPMTGGAAMIVISYVGGTALIMSLLNIALIGGIYFLNRAGY